MTPKLLSIKKPVKRRDVGSVFNKLKTSAASVTALRELVIAE